MSKENISKEYKEINGQTFKIELYYDIGGYNYFTYEPKERGYYGSVTPVKLSTSTEGYTIEEYNAFAGVKKLLYPVKRKSKSSEAKAEKIFEDSIKKELIDYILIQQ